MSVSAVKAGGAKVAFVGCGFVFDVYMRTRWAYPELDIRGVFDIDSNRLNKVAKYYNLRAYPDLGTVLADLDVEIVVNLTSIRSHYEVTKRALEAGKHVYSEKPLTTEVEQTHELFALAARKGLFFTGAPCNLYSDAVCTMWKAVRDGAIGKPVLVYAELDDNPAHLMNLERVQSVTGAPFPYVEEFQEGCTLEHIGYHLAWICAIFGPATHVTAFSKHLVQHKTDTPLNPPDTPDFSVACLSFADGVAARITCTWVSPRDHRMRIIGEEGEISADNIFHDQSRVRIERFSRLSLAARKAHTLRTRPFLGSLFGIGGRKVQLVRRWKSHAVEAERGVNRTLKHRFVSWLRRREVHALDKLLGVAEMARAISDGCNQPMPPDFHMHINELTLMVHRAGPTGSVMTPTTRFDPMVPPSEVREGVRDYRANYRGGRLQSALAGAVDALHRR